MAIPFEPEFTLGMSIPAAMVLGALHVLEPAHGRSILHAFLVGSTGKLRNVLVFGLSVMVTHTAVALFIALGFGLVGEGLVRFGLAPLAKLIGSLITLGFGVRMWSHGTAHSLAHGQGDCHHEGCSSAEEKAPDDFNPIGMGLAGGLIPCYGSIAFVGLWAGKGHLFAAVLPVLAFAVGLSGTLIIGGIFALRAHRSGARQWLRSRIGHWADYVAASIVIILGLVAASLSIMEFFHGAG
jgi:ABC-type nickel/cobalt efflux system permease component RcnA